MRACEAIFQKALDENRFVLFEGEARQICNNHGVQTPEAKLTLNVHDAVKQANEMGYPVALKIASPQIIHKSDTGGVILNVRSEQEVEGQYRKIITDVSRKAPTAKILGVMVEKMLPPSTELIVGAMRDKQFGPTVMFGIGGIFTEIYNDVAFRVAPIDWVDAYNLMHSLKGSGILEGARGKPPADQNAIINLLLDVSRLITEHDSIDQLDLNPVLAYPDRVCAVDARVILKQKTEEHK